MTTTTKTPRALPYARFQRQLDAQIAAHGVTAEQTAAVVRYYRENPLVASSGGQTQYRDAGTSERYTVGYGGERNYSRPAANTSVVEPATGPMVKLIDSLLVERQYTSLTTAQIDDIKKDKSQSHRFIKFLIALPKPTTEVQAPVEQPKPAPAPERARLDFSIIKDGNYAVREDGVVKFYRVSTGKKGYKNVQVRASDELFMLFGKAGIAVLHRIVAAGLAESRMLFVTELGRCCRCGRSLTDEASRANALVNGGLGPDCEGK